MKKLLTPAVLAGVSISVLIPLIGQAQTTGNATVGSAVTNIITLINGSLVTLVFAIAFIVFLWGIFLYFIAGAGNEEKRAQGRTFAIYGLIGFLLMLSVWGIVNLFYYTLFGNGGAGNHPPLPTFQASGSADQGGSSSSAAGG